MEYFEEKDPKEYQIKRIELSNGTILDPDKITHVSVIKNKQIENVYDFKISYGFITKLDLRALSNKCNMLAHVFKFMCKYNMTFEESCIKYDELLEGLKKRK